MNVRSGPATTHNSPHPARTCLCLALVALFALLLAAGSPGAFADDDEPEQVDADEAAIGQIDEATEERRTQRVPAMGEGAFNRLSEAQEALDEEDTDGALAILERMQGQRLNAYEEASMWNMKAFIHFSADDYPEAINAYEQVLTFVPDVPLALELSTLYALGQLYFVEENYERAIDYLNQWFEQIETPSTGAYVFLAQAHYQLEQFEEVIPAVQSAMELAESRGADIEENWWLLKRAAYFELGDFDNVINVLEVLVDQFPSREYWVQLSGLYGEQEREDEQIAAIWAAYIQGYLEEEQEIRNVVGLLQQREAPFWAARILEDAIEAGTVEADLDNLKSLGQAWQMARELDEAIPVYEQAAEMSEDGELDFRIAQLLLDRDECEAGITAAERAIDKAGFDNLANAYLVKGMCEYNLREFEEALATLEEGVGIAREEEEEQTATHLSQWRQHVEREHERELRIAAAEAAADAEADEAGGLSVGT